MTGLVIADDELLIRQGLQTIPWKDYGIELKGVASGGREALSMIEGTLPEILLTDIRMPGMDGLKLIHAAREIVPDIKAILLTGYQDFNYALTAIQLGAFGYILKPSDSNEIISTVLKAKEQVDAEICAKREREKIQQQIGNMQDILLHSFMADRLKNGMSDNEDNETQSAPGGARGDKEAAQRDVGPVRSAVVKQILDYIEAHYMEDISLISVSEHVYMNYIYLSRLIKKETGENFLDILTRTRLVKACEMLGDISLKTYEVAGLVGIKDSGYFSQIFKKYFGMTPSEYRDNILSTKRSRS